MSAVWCSYRARWQGTEYACTVELLPDGLWVHLCSEQPLADFEELLPGVYVRLIPAIECDMVAHVATICEWRGEPCMVHDERDTEGDTQLLLEYTGGKAPRARELGLERIERGVYRGWVNRDEVRGLRESTTRLVEPKN